MAIRLKDMTDNGGRRRLADRRKRSSAYRFPERRWQRHRRSGSDRRAALMLRLRQDLERRDAYLELYEEPAPEIEDSE
ncbi:MAG: hypothetical protein WBN03_06810 [Desulfobacterales bacterium]